MYDISPALGVIIMMNNYFHDVATGLLITSGVGLWVVVRRFQDTGNREKAEYFLSIYRGMKRLARFSLFWILLGGVPRTLFYKSFEWANAVDHYQVPALIVKHVLAFSFVFGGVAIWLRFEKRAKEIDMSLKGSQRADQPAA